MLMFIVEIITIGLPFCAFKIVSGLFFDQKWLLTLGVIDLVLNTINLLALPVLKRKVVDTCFFAFLVRAFKRPHPSIQSKWEDIGNSFDVLFSFLLVAFVIGGGFIPQLPYEFLMIWNISVILNVIGAGSSRMSAAIQNLKV